MVFVTAGRKRWRREAEDGGGVFGGEVNCGGRLARLWASVASYSVAVSENDHLPIGMVWYPCQVSYLWLPHQLSSRGSISPQPLGTSYRPAWFSPQVVKPGRR